MSRDKIYFNDAKSTKLTVQGKYFSATASNKKSAYEKCEELTKTVKILTEKMAQLLTIFLKSVTSLNSSSASTPPPVVTPSTFGV